MNEEELKEIRSKLRGKYDLNIHIDGNKLFCNRIGEHLRDEEYFLEVESLSISICDYILEKYDVFCDYELWCEGYEFVIEVF